MFHSELSGSYVYNGKKWLAFLNFSIVDFLCWQVPDLKKNVFKGDVFSSVLEKNWTCSFLVNSRQTDVFFF